ncbi:ribonuclease Z [Alteribacillus persepolensis]|uniref:Ribonuclease Z n=1 Tax=Alteribacillus persepolensis TaxID=568899 RepID=A0A1G8K9Y8_9BACI|nr:MBL fold metallo-hydrolase [Alteribacillus persepolensis]SDI40265.1 ribonuclease Z [Alteribacillus persepolensis]
MKDIKVTMLGTGSPYPALHRAASAQLLQIDDMNVLIDCGQETTSQLQRIGVEPQDVHHLWFTHLHSDHTMGYFQFLIGGWHLGRRKLSVVGPKGIKEFHETVLKMYEDDINYRTSLGFPAEGIHDVEIYEIEEPGDIPAGDIPAKVTSAPMIHNVTTYAFRFEIDNTVIVFSGDSSPTQHLTDLSENADLLIHDCVLTAKEKAENTNLDTIWEKLQKEHCTPAQAAETAKQSNTKRLLLTHFLPSIDEEHVESEVRRVYDGELILGQDLQTVDLTKKTVTTL